MGPCGAFLSTKAFLCPPPFVGLPWEKKGFPWWKKSFSLLGLPWVPKNRLSPQMLPLNTLPWQPSGSSGLLSPSYLFLFGVCNKCYTCLHHSLVWVDWLYCMQTSRLKLGSIALVSREAEHKLSRFIRLRATLLINVLMYYIASHEWQKFWKIRNLCIWE